MIQGVSYPLQIDKTTGDFKILKGEELLANHLLFFVSTYQGEKLMVPEYGIQNPQFQPLVDILEFNADLALIIQRWIPQIRARCETQYNDIGELLTRIYWAPLPTNELNRVLEWKWSK
jgi:hypothetical protein